jgi:exodeoxyribonuclease VII large subunit
MLASRHDDLSVLQRSLGHVSPSAFIRTSRQRLDDLNAHMIGAQRGQLAVLDERLAARSTALNAANPQTILARGYALVYRSEDGERVTAENDAAPGTGITIKLLEGELKARVEDKASHERYKRTLF